MARRRKEESPGLTKYENAASKELRINLAEHNIPNKLVAAGLETKGIKETEKGLSAKMVAGTFSLAYYLAVREVLQEMTQSIPQNPNPKK